MGKTKIYSVGFTVHEAQTLVTEKGQPVDPLVVVRCCGREYRTEIKYAKSNVVSWDESHTWTDLCLTDEEWETAYITFEVQAANAFWRNTLLGLVSVQLRLIQLRKTHQIRKALPLQHPDDTDVHGSLRVTVFACAPGEAPPSPGEEEVLEEEDHNDYDDLRKAVIDTNQVVEREAGSRLYHVYVTAYRVEDLPRSSKGARDPFVTCEFAGCKLKSTQARGCCSHTFNECFRFPVVTPLPEDAILIKIWDWNFMKADELIAVGRISFSELRTRQMVPRWFNLYGFDDEEVAQATKVAGQGGRLVANCYLGRILLGARAERLTKEDDLMPAHTVAARPYETPPVIPLAVLADVYEVQGAPGEKVSVEIWCGPARARTKWVTGLETKAAQRAGVAPQAFNRAMEGALGVASYLRGDIPEGEDRFPFDNTEGRVEDLRLVVPEDTKQQWDIIISLYVRGTTKGFMGDTRIAFQRLKMSKIPGHVHNNPRAPIWVPLISTPPFESVKPAPAILMVIEKSKVEAFARSKRKHVTAVGYQLRAYVYAARNLLSPSGALPNPFVQVACAGTSRETEVFEQTSSPVFMDCLLLDITMMTDPVSRLPTVAPIVVTLFEQRSWGIQFLGRATCHYDRLRGRLKPGESPTVAEPRWIKLRGGKYANRHLGDVLLLLELIRKRDAEIIPAFPMRPVVNMCNLTFSCLGVRSLYMTQRAKRLDYVSIRKGQDKKTELRRIRGPLLRISVSSYASAGRGNNEAILRYERNLPEDPTTVNKLWTTVTKAANADIFKVVNMEIDVPVDPIYDPRLVVQVYDRKQKPKYFIGEYSMSLVPLIPWVLDQQSAIEAVSPVNDFTDTVDLKHLGGLLRGFHGNSKNRGTGQIGLEALSAADRETADAHKEKTLAQSRFATYDPDNKTFSDSWLLPSGLPKILVSSYAVPGFRCDVIYTNMFTLNVYIPAKFVLFAEGKRAADKKTKEQYARPSVDSTLEQFLDDVIFPSDSLKKSVMGDIDVTGFVKFFVNLTHHEEPNPHVDSSAAEWASSEDRMRRHLRGEDAYPKLLKIRVYVIRAISLYVGDDRILPNPYLLFNLGDKSDTLRAEAKPNTHNPEFFTVWEKDVMFPDDSQFELQVWSAHEGTSGGLDDIFIGSTCIDLEERWFSKEWQKSMSKNQVPMEYRPLKQMPSGSFKGTVEMWVELMDFQKAGEVPKFDLQSPAATEVEIRVIVWGARNLNFKALGKDFVDAMIRCNLDCTGYRGSQPIAQQTDVHYYSKTGAAIFNWRMVYSRVVMPVSTCVLQIAAYDNRNMGESPFIGEVNLELRRYLERVASTLNSIDVDAELKLINRSRESADVSSFGFVQVSLQFISQSEATSKPVGLGREPPNRDPRLTTPQEGRKWEDVLGSAGLRVDYRPLWYWVRVAAVVFLSIWIFVVAFLYPSLLG
ncbi:putative heat shock protein DNAJ pfj4 [Toxoplasma gondii TgCatPRC2]|uniref:Ferlin 2 n=16 Tax=Toxoplasma gondii TaxID=5811 RepID=FER2_TOXGO|nr:heat shock protein DNAJ pfj4, putative [Toxoplasma gondii ME49]EPR62810.1 putative heat shock protein DNAJ pfj4 [Toxoplasma gondii GT1]ESS32062.1 putative heat shock protein DNAJ pfj4 [Toxoplasma gondii VEG]KAF4641177.1 putative heat shock protein DNAJ pfj4 [Toxoplasma gondii]KFG39935.1 putative heat shock protein DNAJ pfj4 [Toxoplasma gondii p89]KFG40314.1 putative heat shock protein DNAJ pfj4 [Toxoplasma gondii FOU]KFG49186.1 putative heat shock protein DNAJ pfj4 [Toxoplasma gondii GAB2-|eukprot:XP_018637070.1 heat shock protein DNAJ pfj4, putative [Toxoplasma gondii ME49]